MDVINLSEKKQDKKTSGRFKVTIDTIKATNSLFISYDINIEDYDNLDFIKTYTRNYTGNAPEKEAQKMIDQIKKRHVEDTKIYYVD